MPRGRLQHEIFSETIARINEASGPYQMSYTLGDAIVMDKDASGAWKVSRGLIAAIPVENPYSCSSE